MIARLKGSQYEALCVETLAAAGFLLRRRGGPGDAGIDLVGRFESFQTLPPMRSSTDVDGCSNTGIVAQCKSEAKPLGPVYVREFEGVMSSRCRINPHLSDKRSAGVGFLISASPFTAAALRQASVSSLPLGLIHLDGLSGCVHAVVQSRSLCDSSYVGILQALKRLAASPVEEEKPCVRG